MQEVLEDYIVWEETGRTEFGYSATTSEVGILYQLNNPFCKGPLY